MCVGGVRGRGEAGGGREGGRKQDTLFLKLWTLIMEPHEATQSPPKLG